MLQAPEPGRPARKYAADDRWAALAGREAGPAYDAVCDLAARPDVAVALLSQRLRPARRDDRMERLVADLDSRQFAERERATRELERLGGQAESALRRAVGDRPSLELRRRADQLLAALDRLITDPETLRAIRAVEVLERVGTPAARLLLEELAAGDPDARLTREAHASLQRLVPKAPPRP